MSTIGSGAIGVVAAQQSLEPDRFEPNDTLDQAASISPGTYDNLTVTQGDIDFYALNVMNGDSISAAIDFSHAEGDLDLFLLNSGGEVVAQNISETDGEELGAVATQSGPYYVAVAGFDNASASYALSVSVGDGQGQNVSDEFEPNDSFDEPRTLEPGSYPNLTIAANDVDVYAVEATVGQTVRATIDFSHAEGDLDLFVFGPDRTPLQQSTSESDGEDVSQVVTRNGTYYIVVAGFQGATAAYDMTIERSLASGGGSGDGDRFEPNDGPDSATRLTPGRYEDLSITTGDYDFFTVNLTAGQQLSTTVEFVHSEGDIDAAIFGPDGSLLQTSESITDYENLSLVAGQSGTYTMVVLSRTNGTTPYALNVSISGSSGEESSTDGPVELPINSGEQEPNDDFDTATPLAPGTYGDLSITDDDIDVYAIEGVSGQTLSSSINFSHAAGDLDLYLFDSSFNLVQASTSESDNERISALLDEDGPYYLVVAGYQGATGTYDLSVGLSGVESPPDPDEDVIGWENGYWANESLSLDTTDGFSENEREAILARGMARVEELREAEFRRDVGFQVISREEAAPIFGGSPTDRLRRGPRLNQLYEATFIVDEPTDAYDVVIGTNTATVGGFYIPGTDQFYLITEDPTRPQVDEGVLIHELVHALQDQLNLSTQSSGLVSYDQQAAGLGLSEGEANFIEARYERRCANGTWTCVPTPDTTGEPENDVNLGVNLIGFQPYSDGPAFVADLYQEGGWEAVEAAYDNPPVSTEQTINPDRYPDEVPRTTPSTEEATGEWRAFDQERLGESWIFTMFWYQTLEYDIPVIEPQLFDPDQGRYDTLNYTSQPSSGWGNDRLVMYTNGSQYGYVWTTEWDTETDATQFAEAYRQVLRGHGGEETADGTWVIPEGQPYADTFRVVQNGQTVTIVNAPEASAVDALAPGLADSQPNAIDQNTTAITVKATAIP